MTAAEIIKAVSGITNISKYALIEGGRSSFLVAPRHLCFYLIRDLLKYSYPRIGTIMHRDHATVMNGVRRAEGLLDTDQVFRDLHEKVLTRLAERKAA